MIFFGLKKKKAATIVVLKEDLIWENLDEFAKLLEDLKEEGKTKLVLDLEEVRFVSAKAIGLMASAILEFRKQQGDIKFLFVSEYLKKVFKLVKLDQYVEFFEDEQEALLSFGGQVSNPERMLLWSLDG